MGFLIRILRFTQHFFCNFVNVQRQRHWEYGNSLKRKYTNSYEEPLWIFAYTNYPMSRNGIALQLLLHILFLQCLGCLLIQFQFFCHIFDGHGSALPPYVLGKPFCVEGIKKGCERCINIVQKNHMLFGLIFNLLILKKIWCRRRESNPHDPKAGGF